MNFDEKVIGIRINYFNLSACILYHKNKILIYYLARCFCLVPYNFIFGIILTFGILFPFYVLTDYVHNFDGIILTTDYGTTGCCFECSPYFLPPNSRRRCDRSRYFVGCTLFPKGIIEGVRIFNQQLKYKGTFQLNGVLLCTFM